MGGRQQRLDARGPNDEILRWICIILRKVWRHNRREFPKIRTVTLECSSPTGGTEVLKAHLDVLRLSVELEHVVNIFAQN